MFISDEHEERCGDKKEKREKEFDRIMTYKKSYEGTIRLGQFTDTDDAEGEILETFPVPNIHTTTIENALKNFVGNVEQTPPKYSALKIDGKPSYKLARQGKRVCRIETPYREHMAQHFSVTYSRIGLPQPYETQG